MEIDREHLTPAKLASVDLAEKDFAKHVWTLAAEADAVFEQDFGVKCTNAEHKDALHTMDILAKLALKVNCLTHLCEQLDHIISGFVNLMESWLITKVPTRWGSEYHCLECHEKLKDAINDLTNTSQHGCCEFHFSQADWKQLTGLKNILNKHSKVSSLEIANVYKAFEELEVSLDKACNDLALNKAYYAKLNDCEVYAIVTILTPTLGYQWFNKNNGWPEAWKQLPLMKIHQQWATYYKPKLFRRALIVILGQSGVNRLGARWEGVGEPDTELGTGFALSLGEKVARERQS
ncbi:hypothetical protein BS47DRAFT_1367346 [Hydnum rufescens UP504]|uniref:Uncharacterized protein n=1 Tax=Hydnum rufescens UP504 TaxID=1448309 RepID=A0A9P6DKZ1_9AGAM|nr:hypothetical protein BS47DRAFT_1367346 [Hydnum rufescens UP504]